MTRRAPEPPSSDNPESDGLSVNATVYGALKRLIVESRLRPGMKLVHQELAERLGVSRTPVREGLERLYQEGLVSRIPRRGFYVAEIDEHESRELYELREALETFALRLSMSRGIPARELSRLEALNRRYGTLLRDGATHERMLVDRDFHLALARCSGNGALVRALESVFDRLIVKIRTEGYRTVRGEEAMREHVALLTALRAQEANRAPQLLARHIQGAKARLEGHLRETGRSFTLP